MLYLLMCANNGELEMTRKIQEAIQEMIVDEKIYMIEREGCKIRMYKGEIWGAVRIASLYDLSRSR